MKIAVLVVRVLLGAVLLAAGGLKVGHPVDLAATISGFRMMPGYLAGPLALALPYLEIVLGAYLAAGIFTRAAAWIAAGQFAIYAAAIASAVLRHIPANCGCFGPTDNTPADWPHVAADMTLAFMAAFVAWGAPGAFALEPRILKFARHRTLAWIGAGVLAAIAVGSVAWYNFHPSHELIAAAEAPPIGKAALGSTAPEFQAATTAGFFDLAKTDRPVFLEVFATWCPHCQHMSAVIDKLYAKYGARVAFVAVSGSDTAMDGTSTASELDVLDWQTKFGVRYPVAYDPDLTVAGLYLQGGFPTLALIDKDKKIVYLDSGEIPYATLDRAIGGAL